MPPVRGRKPKSTASTRSSNQEHPIATAESVPPKIGAPVATPSKSPSKRKMRITQSQKQALIDNLQLEITERARKMRAQYALQAQGLRTRLEIRVHRIPAALRKTTIAELLEKYSDQTNVTLASVAGRDVARGHQKTSIVAKPSVSQLEAGRGTKRKSDESSGEKDDANMAQPEQKKRARAANAQPAKDDITAPRGAARNVQHSQILSPKSNNSRTLPQSPIKPTISPMKSNLARPVSPLKPSSTAPTATSLAKTADKPSKSRATASRAASKQDQAIGTMVPKQTRQKRAAPGPPPRLVDEDSNGIAQRASNVSDAASSSAGTTIVRTTRKAPPAPSTVSAVTKGKVANVKAKFEGISGNGRKVTAAKAAATTATSNASTMKGGRTLRKRA